MKIATRIISGYGLFIAVLFGLVIYQAITIHRMQAISKTLSEINFQSIIHCSQALRDLDLVAEYTEKSFRAQDPAYMDKLLESQKDFQKSLAELQRHANPGEEQDEVKRLSRQWDSYNVDLGLLQQSPSQIRNALPLNLQEDLERLYSQTTSVYQSSLRSMSAMVERSRKTADTAVLGLWCATFAALAISILVSLLIVHSISKPLAHLTEGTRAIADGKFSYRLDTTRNDELSQLARDFNTMTLRLKELEKEIDLQRKPSQPPQ